MAHHYQEVGMSVSNAHLTKADLNVDKGIREVIYLIYMLQKAIINPKFQENVWNQMQQVLQVPPFEPHEEAVERPFGETSTMPNSK